jgi:Holliday junction resolvasome RuvABC endonuclease subunit
MNDSTATIIGHIAHPVDRVSIGVDPGKAAGWGFLVGSGCEPPKLYSAGIVHSDAAAAIQRVLITCGKAMTPEELALGNMANVVTLSTLPAGSTVRLIVEDQWIPRAGGPGSGDAAVRKAYAQATAALGVAVCRGKWMAVAELLGIEVVVVHPSTWRSAVLGRQWVNKPRDQCKAQALLVVQAMYGLRLPKNHDHVAEALCLATYVDTELRQERRVKGAS